MSKWLHAGEARGFAMPEDRVERLQVMLSAEEAKALDDWRFAKRMPSRAAAIRELLRRGLAAEGFDTAQAGQRSSDYGVISTPQVMDGQGVDGIDRVDGGE